MSRNTEYTETRVTLNVLWTKQILEILLSVPCTSCLLVLAMHFTSILSPPQFYVQCLLPKLLCLLIKTLFKAPKVWGGHGWRSHIREVAKKGPCGRSAMRFLDKKLQVGDAMHSLALMCLVCLWGAQLFRQGSQHPQAPIPQDSKHHKLDTATCLFILSFMDHFW